jgi:hypothetical protein
MKYSNDEKPMRKMKRSVSDVKFVESIPFNLPSLSSHPKANSNEDEFTINGRETHFMKRSFPIVASLSVNTNIESSKFVEPPSTFKYIPPPLPVGLIFASHLSNVQFSTLIPLSDEQTHDKHPPSTDDEDKHDENKTFLKETD